MNILHFKATLIALVILLYSQSAQSLSIQTHEALNEEIAKKSMNDFSLDDYLKTNLGINGGVNELFNNNDVSKWMKLGGAYEDDPSGYWIPYRRSRNHFHNPLLPLSQAGYTSWGSFCDVGHCPASAIIWTLGPQTSDYYLGLALNPGGDWSWQMTRQNYYNALTATAPAERDTNFAKTFRGLGHLMHLVQDMSVPEHARNDGHAAYAYEEWVRDSLSSNDAQRKAVWTSALANPIFIDMAALSQPSAFGAEAPVPIASLFDTNQYNGTNPQATLNQNIGLSEYTNANFFSGDTIFSPNYPNPAKENTNARLVEVQAEDGVTDYTYFIFLDGQNCKLAAYSYFINEFSAGGVVGSASIPGSWKYNLNDDVFSDYMTHLIPRAVGYSAGLLNYFFRGQMDIVDDPAQQGKYNIRNRSSENMSGVFNLYYDDINNGRRLITSWDISINANGQSASLSFTPPSDANEPCRYVLVFRGQIGHEQGAVVGRALRIGQCVAVTGRLLQASRWNANTVYVNVFTESGLISTNFSILNDQVAAVRFNLSNFNEFIVAVQESDYKFHKFTINESNRTIQYDGVALTMPRNASFDSRQEVMSECSYTDRNLCGWGLIFSFAFYETTHKWETFSLHDFYYNGDIIKPFGQYTEGKNVYLKSLSFCGDYAYSSKRYYDLERSFETGVFYGGKLASSYSEQCINGLPASNCASDSEDRHPCTASISGTLTDYYQPLAIFNESDLAYAHFQYPYQPSAVWFFPPQPSWSQFVNIVSPAPITPNMSWPVSSLPRQIKTMLRKDAGQSFYDNFNSYTSELGVVQGPAQKLVSGDNAYQENMGWDSNGSIIACSLAANVPECTIEKDIGGSFIDPFDVILNFVE